MGQEWERERERERETLLGVVEVVDVLPVEVANESEDGVGVVGSHVDGIRVAGGCCCCWGSSRSAMLWSGRGQPRLRHRQRRGRSWLPPAGKHRRRRGWLDVTGYDDRHLERAGERLHRGDRQVTGYAEHREDSAGHRQTFYNKCF